MTFLGRGPEQVLKYWPLDMKCPLVGRQFLARIVLPTDKVGEAMVLQPGAGLFYTDRLTDHRCWLPPQTPTLTGHQSKASCPQVLPALLLVLAAPLLPSSGHHHSLLLS